MVWFPTQLQRPVENQPWWNIPPPRPLPVGPGCEVARSHSKALPCFGLGAMKCFSWRGGRTGRGPGAGRAGSKTSLGFGKDMAGAGWGGGGRLTSNGDLLLFGAGVVSAFQRHKNVRINSGLKISAFYKAWYTRYRFNCNWLLWYLALMLEIFSVIILLKYEISSIAKFFPDSIKN